MHTLTPSQIEAVLLQHGYTTKVQPDGSVALNPYVFTAANALLHLAQDPPPATQVPWGYLASTVGEIWAEQERPDDTVRAGALYPITQPDIQGEPVAFHVQQGEEVDLIVGHHLANGELARLRAEGAVVTPLSGIAATGHLDERIEAALTAAGFAPGDAARLAQYAAHMEDDVGIWQVRLKGSEDPWTEVSLSQLHGHPSWEVRRLVLSPEDRA